MCIYIYRNSLSSLLDPCRKPLESSENEVLAAPFLSAQVVTVRCISLQSWCHNNCWPHVSHEKRFGQRPHLQDLFRCFLAPLVSQRGLWLRGPAAWGMQLLEAVKFIDNQLKVSEILWNHWRIWESHWITSEFRTLTASTLNHCMFSLARLGAGNALAPSNNLMRMQQKQHNHCNQLHKW